MALTDHSDLYASFHERGFNRILEHVMRQRPSLFNYGTALLAANPERMCESISAHPIVGERSNPEVTIVDPLPIPGTNYGLNFCVQLVQAAIDFHPGNVVDLPDELAPLDRQRLAMAITVCGGIGCPHDEMIDRLVYVDALRDEKDEERRKEPGPIVPIPFEKLHCFCVSAYVEGGLRRRILSGTEYLEPTADGFEIVDLTPEGLENSLECYIVTMLRLHVLPGLRTALDGWTLSIADGLPSIKLTLTPTGSGVPFNPAIEDDQVKVRIDVEVV